MGIFLGVEREGGLYRIDQNEMIWLVIWFLELEKTWNQMKNLFVWCNFLSCSEFVVEVANEVTIKCNTTIFSLVYFSMRLCQGPRYYMVSIDEFSVSV